MRQKEIIGFQWGEIDWNGKYIEILRANWKVPMVGPNQMITTPNGGAKSRYQTQLVGVLQDH